MPFQARLTTCAATTSLDSPLSRLSSHHWPVSATNPTSICAYIGARAGSRWVLANSPASRSSAWLATSDRIVANEPSGEVADDPREMIAKPSGRVSM